ncbi:hypothetical protein EHE19_008685 [Ruminiclostridium herbifermentans]|uniref:CRISPR type III-associated protein domain-containing protein n=1 Tax=Ruminiclostridium herbifermentans TaxID=2488810 RepID=A0A4U7JKX1_9FIRM|nr:RAMP superfamily CRISPR-associated protein [Ruminiclostridium herbifermentans]QNU68456.1 hypothetical protein EHE19_008685 [Ruminiclostridium herbifermentans]
MIEYNLKMKLLSDTMFGNGEALPGVFDNDIITDQYGIPYLKAKTFKGHVREKMHMVVNLLPEITKEDGKTIIDELLGSDSQEKQKHGGILKFSDFKVSKRVQSILQKSVEDNKLFSEEITDAFTTSYTFTELNDGVAKEHSLRRCRMITAGFIFYSTLYCDRNLSDLEQKVLTYSIGMIQHIGAYKSKGKGLVNLEISLGDKNLTEQYIHTA